MKRTKRLVCAILALVMMLTILPVSASAADDVKDAIGIVTASALRLRSSASTSSSTVATAYKGDYVVVLSQEGSWYKVIYNLKVGYMHADYLTVKERENVELGYGKVDASAVNIRSKPTTSSSVVAKATRGEKAFIIGFNCGWYKVHFDGKTGYIRSDLLELTEIPYENTGSKNDPKYFINGDPISGSNNSGSASTPDYSAGEAIVAKAKQYIGVPYVWGGTSPSGFDCSGFVQYVMKACGYSINRTASAQLNNGTPVAYADLQPGDLVFFERTYNTSSPASHVGIYIGNGQFIHASTGGVCISNLSANYYASRYTTARRVWN